MEVNKESSRCPGPATTGEASKRRAEEEAHEDADHETSDTVDRAAGVDEYPDPDDDDDDDEDYDDDHFIWNLNRMRRLNLMTPEWIEEMKRDHLQHVAVFSKYLDDDDDDDEEVADEAAMAEFDDFCKNIFANIDLSGLNTAGGESCGMDAVGVYGGKSLPPESSS